MATRTPGPAARAAGEALAADHYQLGSRRHVREAVDPTMIAALALLAMELMAACLEARRRRGEPAPSGYLLRREAVAIAGARLWWPPDWPMVRVRRSMEAIAGRRALRQLNEAGLPLKADEAVKLALRGAGRAAAIDLEMLAREAERPEETPDEARPPR
jgi:hypothetical protein